MRRILTLCAFIWLIVPNVLHAGPEMGSYCSAPPYVTRSIIPNLLVLMDNSADMENPAYTDSYDPAKTYRGYFAPSGCYGYSQNSFNETYKPQPPATNAATSYTMSDTCPAGAPFRGNLLNWATTSRYDILEDVLLGGNSVSKQSNVNTLLSISGDWTDTTNPATPAKVYNGCQFIVSNANLTVKDVTANSCTLLNATPAPIAFWDGFSRQLANGFKRVYFALVNGSDRTLAYAAGAWDKVCGVTKAWAATAIAVSINTGNLNGTAGTAYGITLQALGANNRSTTVYTWNVTTIPAWLTAGASTTKKISGKYYGLLPFSGTPPAPGSYTLVGTVTDNSGDLAGTFSYTIVISAAPLIITTPSGTTLNAGTQNAPYSYSANAVGGVGPYTWSAANLPPGLTIDPATGVISGTPTTTGTFSSISITVTDSRGTSVTKSGLSMTVAVGSALRSQQYNVKVGVLEEPLTDLNGNNIWDLGETFTDQNGNGVWDGKHGLLQKYWDNDDPRARWGLMNFGQSGGETKVIGNPCIPASPLNSFLTGVQNATATPNSPLAQGLYGALNYYANTGTGYQGCASADPIPDDTYQSCRKNFVLVISSGSNVGPASGFNFNQSTCAVTNNSAPLVQNACYGYKNDLRSDRTARQNVYTYIVNTMGTNAANNAILQDAASAGGGKYYAASDASQLEQQLQNAMTDILAGAASGTAVSVLTTSSRGTGSMIQAYFLPTREDGTRQIWWTGYTQNLWIDPNDNLREDTHNDFSLKLDEDNVLKLFFDAATNETKAATFTTLADGTGGTMATCSSPTIRPFSSVAYLWEAGMKLASKAPNSRTVFTSKNVIQGTASTYSFTDTPYPTFISGMAAEKTAALNPDATFTADNIIRYIRGECLETGVQGDAACGSTLGTVFRDRRITVGGSLKVWKLGDVISSTPKVFSNTPLNTYNLDYNDPTYFSYFSGDGYTNKSAVGFVGANDGMLHAFRIGYLKSTGLLSSIMAMFQNFFSGDTGNDKLGEEMWSFIPFNAFPYLKYLADPAYCHLYYNDLSVRLVDASLGGADNPNPGDIKTVASWKTILIGGMRFGGAPAGGTPAPPAGLTNVGFSSYYAIDVTDPEHPVPLWEFSDDDMGYATTFPSVIRTANDDGSTNGNWYAVFGSGSAVLPKSQTDIGRSTPGYLYILNLKTGALVKKINLNDHAIVGDILAVDVNKDYSSETLYFGTAYNPAGTWNGKVMRLAIPSDVSLLCDAGVNVTYASCTGGSPPPLRTLFSGTYPFTASPDAAKDVDGNVWVYAGSGKYYSDVDEGDSSNQIFLGVKDKTDNTIAYPQTTATLRNSTPDPVTGANVTTGTVSGTSRVCGYSPGSDPANGDFGFQTFVTSINPTSAAASDATTGWYYLLVSPERVISRPLAVGGLVDFLTYQPSSDPCSYGGNSYLYSVGYTTGVAPTTVSIHASATTDGVTTGSVTVRPRVLLGPGAPPTGEAIIIPPPKGDTLKKKIQVATGVIVEAENQPVTSVASKIVHWLRK